MRSTASTNSSCWKLRSEPRRALCRPHVGPMVAYLGRWRQPRHPLRTHLCAGSFSTRANTKRACKLSPTHPSCIRPLGLPASPPTHISHTALAMLGLACRMLGTGWTQVGVSWADVGPMLTYFEYVGPMLGVAGPKLAILALCRPHVGPMLAYLGRWRQPPHPLRMHLCAGSFSTRANTKRACKLSPTHPSCIRPLGLPASPPTHISHTALAMLGLACRMLGTGWTQVGVSWADVGPMLTYFESMLGPYWA